MSRSRSSCTPHPFRKPTLNACAPVTYESDARDSQILGAFMTAKMKRGPFCMPAPRYSRPGIAPPCSVTAISDRHTSLGSSRHAALCLSLIHISEPTRLLSISYAVFCLKKKKQTKVITQKVPQIQSVTELQQRTSKNQKQH